MDVIKWDPVLPNIFLVLFTNGYGTRDDFEVKNTEKHYPTRQG